MKNIFLLLFIGFLSASFISKNIKVNESRKRTFLPPGTVKINDTLFVDEAEVTNFSWQEYELWMMNKYGFNSTQHIACLPDTLVWRSKNSFNEPYVQYYYRHPAYKNYPVVGISYEQAIAFCKWRTERVKENLCLSKKYGISNFAYRLPSKTEWEFVSNNGVGYFLRDGRNEKGQLTSNHVWEPRDSIEAKKISTYNDNADVTAPVYSYWKNLFGLYNMIGNVSEMVAEKGISKGGGWRHLLEKCRVGNDITYEKPTAWLGFRCVCVVKPNS